MKEPCHCSTELFSCSIHLVDVYMAAIEIQGMPKTLQTRGNLYNINNL